MQEANYKIELRLDGLLLGDVSSIAQNLVWRKCRTNSGVDEIDFTLNDRVFADWCAERNTDIKTMLKPYALDARVIRNGEALVGGFLATMPAYQPQADSANLALKFDGYMNLLAGVYLRPRATVTKAAGAMVKDWIDYAEGLATAAGKPFGITAGTIQTLNSIQRTFDNYKPVKEAITDLTDNVDGAGPFQGVATISAQEVQGFASHIIALGAGETSSDPSKSTVIVAEATDGNAVTEYAYVEQLMQYSSISRQNTLNTRSLTDLAKTTRAKWLPEVTLLGRQTPPSPTASYGLWIGDTIWINNDADMTGQTSGKFRINVLEVSRSASGGEKIKPTLERIA